MQMETSEIKGILSQIGYAKKSLGQHFLTSAAVVAEMVQAAEIKKEDLILEIGPGLGILTKALAASPAQEIILCEKDRRLCDFLKGEYDHKKFKIICEDALTLIPNLRVGSPLKVVSNLPYNVSSPIIVSLLTACPTMPERMILMLQKEVADRLVAPPHDSNRGILTVLIELCGEAKIIKRVPRNLFYPEPQVDSAVVGISNINEFPFEAKDALRILKLSFAGKRKKIKNSLFSALKISRDEALKIAKDSEITLEMRPEELTRDQWTSLIKNLTRRSI